MKLTQPTYLKLKLKRKMNSSTTYDIAPIHETTPLQKSIPNKGIEVSQNPSLLK